MPQLGLLTRTLAAIGFMARSQSRFVLTICSLGVGVLWELPQRSSWRAPVRAEFARAMRQTIGGCLITIVIVAALIGFAMVYESLFWLGEAGEEQLIGSILVTVLMRAVAPLLVGVVLLGRNGASVAAEIGALQPGQVGQLAAHGIDPFMLLVLPRAAAFAVAAYTLGVLFIVTALAAGFGVGIIAGGVRMSLWEFFSTVLGAMQPVDFVVFPAKMLTIGLLIALTSVLTGLNAQEGEGFTRTLSRSFARGMVAIILTSTTLGLMI